MTGASHLSSYQIKNRHSEQNEQFNTAVNYPHSSFKLSHPSVFSYSLIIFLTQDQCGEMGDQDGLEN